MANICFLYSEMMPYMEAVINELVVTYNDSVLVISWDKKNKTPHQPHFSNQITHLKRSSLTREEIYSRLADFHPALIYISGRMDKDYLACVLKFKKKIPIVSGCDNQWNNSLKQVASMFFAKWLYQKYFTHLWVSGPRQYAFAKRMGYPNTRIKLFEYSANSRLFQQVFERRESNTGKGIKKVIFIGRLEPLKGADLLCEAFDMLLPQLKEEWQLVLFGNGSLEKDLEKFPFAKCEGFKSQQGITEQLDGDIVFCLPSRYEPWGVVVHEMCCAGVPIILSDEVGASDELLIHGFNGYLCKANSVHSLYRGLLFMMNLSKEERLNMGQNSNLLSKRLSPAINAASLRSILESPHT